MRARHPRALGDSLMFSQYRRLRLPVTASNVQVIRAARRQIAKRAWHDCAYRDGRKLHYRNMLEYHHEAQRLAHTWG